LSREMFSMAHSWAMDHHLGREGGREEGREGRGKIACLSGRAGPKGQEIN